MNAFESATKINEEVASWRRELHQHPQTAYEEEYISTFIQKKLADFNIEFKTGWAKTGVVGIIKGKSSARKIALRADIDALDISEENSFDYKSRIPGKMHACGHDGHTSMLLGAAKLLSENRDFNGDVILIFQPAEEGGAGGDKMLQQGLFEKYNVDSIWGMHNWPGLSSGEFAMNHGGFMASTWDIDIELTGKGGHAAAPHKTMDVIPATASLVTALQTIVSRNTDPLAAGVLSITQIHSGTTNNIIPQKAKICGTLRTLDSDVQKNAVKRIYEITENIAAAYNLKANIIEKPDNYPVLVNTQKETDTAYQVCQKIVREPSVHRHFPPTMGAEDFAFMLQKKPGCYIFMGNGNYGEKGGQNLHSSRYDFNDDAAPYGISYWVELTSTLLT